MFRDPDRDAHASSSGSGRSHGVKEGSMPRTPERVGTADSTNSVATSSSLRMVEAAGARAGQFASALFGTVAQAAGLSPERTTDSRPSSQGSSFVSEKAAKDEKGETVPAIVPRPRRLMRAMRPPPLAALQLWPTPQAPCFLTRALAEEIRHLLPPRLQAHDHWQCIYNLAAHGVSLKTLYRQCAPYRDRVGERPGFVLAVQDRAGQVFGGYANEHFRPEASYFGNGECFLWKSQRLSSRGSAITTAAAGQGEPMETELRFKAFPWTGENDYQIYCTPQFLSFGGGDGHYGLWLDDRLEFGVSGSTVTFGNESLCDGVEPGRRFEVVSLEVWKV